MTKTFIPYLGTRGFPCTIASTTVVPEYATLFGNVSVLSDISEHIYHIMVRFVFRACSSTVVPKPERVMYGVAIMSPVSKPNLQRKYTLRLLR